LFSSIKKNPEPSVVELSDKNKSFGYRNPEHAVIVLSDKTKRLEMNSPVLVVPKKDFKKV